MVLATRYNRFFLLKTNPEVRFGLSREICLNLRVASWVALRGFLFREEAMLTREEQLYEGEESNKGSKMLSIVFSLIAIAGIAALFFLCFPSCARADVNREQAILAIIGEAEGECYQGKVAVAEVIRRRGSLKGVYGVRAHRVVNNLFSKKTYLEAVKAWEESAKSNLSKGATHWEGTAFKTPYWAKSMKVVAVIGNQRFYKEVRQ